MGLFADETVAGIHGGALITVRFNGEIVSHHAHIHIVIRSTISKLRFACIKTNLSFIAQAFAIVQLNIFFCGHGYKVDSAVQLLHHAGMEQCGCHAIHDRDLNVMTAGMYGAGRGITIRMIAANHRIQFPHNGDFRSRSAFVCIAAATGISNASVHGQTQLLQRFGKGLGCADFTITGFRVLINFLTQGQDGISVPIYLLDHQLLHLFLVHRMQPPFDFNGLIKFRSCPGDSGLPGR